jgi:hypothetical protein
MSRPRFLILESRTVRQRPRGCQKHKIDYFEVLPATNRDLYGNRRIWNLNSVDYRARMDQILQCIERL